MAPVVKVTLRRHAIVVREYEVLVTKTDNMSGDDVVQAAVDATDGGDVPVLTSTNVAFVSEIENIRDYRDNYEIRSA